MSEIVNKQHLDFDPLLTAEQITGKSYKEDDETSSLGLVLHILHNKDKQKRLNESMDTYYSQKENGFMEVVADLGFKKVYSEDFDGNYVKDELAVWVLKEGVLLVTETFGWSSEKERSINKASIYYNIEPLDGDPNSIYPCLQSGGFHKNPDGKLIWVGNHDVREGLRFHVNQLRKYGRFVTPWFEQPHLHIFPYIIKGPENDHRYHWYTDANNIRLKALPDDVKKMFGIKLESYIN